MRSDQRGRGKRVTEKEGEGASKGTCIEGSWARRTGGMESNGARGRTPVTQQ